MWCARGAAAAILLAAVGLLLLAAHAPSPPLPLPPAPAPHKLQPQTTPSSAPPAVPSPAAVHGPPTVADVYVSGHAKPHAELCPALGAKIRLLILISSAPSHEHARSAVRLTWGHFASRADVALAFVLGAPDPTSPLHSALEAEDALYGDLVHGNFVDSYSNLTLKTLSMLEWADTYCPRAPHILKTDDDMFVNIPRLLSFLSARANSSKTIWGRVVRRSAPKRAPSSKYFVSREAFPDKVFPDFATGPAYVMTSDCVRTILAAAPSSRYVRLEDVFVTGILASRLRLKRTHAQEFLNRRVAATPCVLQRSVSIHMVRYHEQFDLWRKLLDGRAQCH